MKTLLFEILITLIYWWFISFWALVVAWYLGLVWSALLFAVLFIPYYYLVRRIL